MRDSRIVCRSISVGAPDVGITAPDAAEVGVCAIVETLLRCNAAASVLDGLQGGRGGDRREAKQRDITRPKQ